MNNKVAKPNEPLPNLEIASIIEVDGMHIVAELSADVTELTRIYAGELYAIGQFGSIVRVHFGRKIIYGYVSRLRMKAEYEKEKGIERVSENDARVIEADLFGEAEWIAPEDDSLGWELHFDRGVSTFPLPQQCVYLTPKSELNSIFSKQKAATIYLGEHVGAGGAPCFADLNELLGKHTAVLGSTGAGKSGTVAALLHAMLERGSKNGYSKWNPRIIILDPHNEYGSAFKESVRLSTDERSLRLPYWLLDLQETIGLIIGKTEFVATSQSNVIKSALLAVRREAATQIGLDESKITVDSPIPYSIGDPKGMDEFGKKNGVLVSEGFVGAVNSLRPSNANKKDHEEYNKVINKLDVLCSDSRLTFMMEPWDGKSDSFGDIASQFFGDGSPVRIVDLSGVPNEVAGATSSAIARMLFHIKLWQTSEERDSSPILLICEEAHRYVPNRGEAIYQAAQEAVRRLAKEGRKYGIGLMLVSQRPSEVDATVLSQCNSWVVMRITNDADRDHVKSVLPDALVGLSKVLSGLRRREAIFVGQAAMLPSRVLIRFLEEDQLPRSHDIDFDKGWQGDPLSAEKLIEIAGRWRYQSR